MKNNEKIVPLNEDLNGHVQDDASYLKAKQAQENMLQQQKEANKENQRKAQENKQNH